MRRERQNLFFCLFRNFAKAKMLVPIVIGIFLFFSLIIPSQAIIIVPSAMITGIIRDAVSNEVIAEARVLAVETNIYPDCMVEYGEDKCFDNHYIFNQTQTNSEGSYNFTIDACGLPLLLVVEKEGYLTFQQSQYFNCWSTQVINITLTPDSPTGPEPVIIIPGIMASWNRNLLDKNLEYVDQWELDPHFHTYDQLISDLQTYGEYILGESLFTFPYDWRKNNEFTAQLLKAEIKNIKNQTGAEKVDLIAHSMGGLVARYYIESNLYQNDVDQLIFIATPQRGAPKAYLAWEGGYLGTNMVSDFVKELLVAKIAKTDGYCDSMLNRNKCVYNYVRGYPVASLQQLLPDTDYLQSALNNEPFLYPSGYPVNDFLENLNKQQNLTKLYNAGIEISTIYNSTPQSTVTGIKVIERDSGQMPFWEHGYPYGFTSLMRLNGVILSDGDYTVPYESSIFIQSERLIPKLNTNHRKIVSLSAKNIIEILKDKFIDIQVIDQPDKYVIIQVHSPVNARVKTPTGSRVGFDFTTGLDVNEVVGAYYSGSGADNEYIILPLAEVGEYEIGLVGTGIGEYEIEVMLADDQGISNQKFSGQIAPEIFVDLKFQINEENLSEILPIDEQLPEVTITSPEREEYEHHLLVPIQYLAIDNSGQIATTSIKLDDEQYSGENIDMFTLDLGEHKLTVKVNDWSGNTTEQEVVFQVIATMNSLRSDINRLYDEGEIKNSKTKKQLLSDVDYLQKILNFYKPFFVAKHLIVEVIIDRIVGELITKRLGFYLRQGNISLDAYNILKQQIIYIINHY